MSNTEPISVYIHNDLGYDVALYWLSHKTSDKDQPTDYTSGGRLQQGGETVKVTFNLVDKTDDFWTVMWTDAHGNLWGSNPFFKAKAFTSDGDIEVQLQGNGSVVEILQQSQKDGSDDFIQYGSNGS